MQAYLLLMQLGLIKTAGAAWRAVRKGLMSTADYARHMKVPVADVEAHLAQQQNVFNKSKNQIQNFWGDTHPENIAKYMARGKRPPTMAEAVKDFKKNPSAGEMVFPSSNFNNPLFSQVQMLPQNRPGYMSLPQMWDKIIKTQNTNKQKSNLLNQFFQKRYGVEGAEKFDTSTKVPWRVNTDPNINVPSSQIVTQEQYKKALPAWQKTQWAKGDHDLLLGVTPKTKNVFADFSHNPTTGQTIIPDIRAINRSPLKYTNYPLWKDTSDTALATIGHEFAHRESYKNPQKYKTLANHLERILAPTAPQLKLIENKVNPLYKNLQGGWNPTATSEMTAHFRATQGNGIAAKAAIRLPLEKMQQVAPEVLTQWQQSLSYLPPNIRDRFLATRAHAYLHYNIQ